MFSYLGQLRRVALSACKHPSLKEMLGQHKDYREAKEFQTSDHKLNIIQNVFHYS